MITPFVKTVFMVMGTAAMAFGLLKSVALYDDMESIASQQQQSTLRMQRWSNQHEQLQPIAVE